MHLPYKLCLTQFKSAVGQLNRFHFLLDLFCDLIGIKGFAVRL